MPRMSEAEKQKSHDRILDAAARLMREGGIEATSVADVMKEAGMTHGGFYRHFATKEALVSAAFRRAVDDALSAVEAAPAGTAQDEALAHYVDRYLSSEHVADRGRGCPLAAMGAEIGRLDGAVQGEAAETVDRVARLLDRRDGGTPDRGIATLALLLGTITLARLAKTPARSTRILDAGRRGTELLDRHWSD